jgi:hypothetical protein
MSDIGPVKRVVRSVPLPAAMPEPVSAPNPEALPGAVPRRSGSVPA